MVRCAGAPLGHFPVRSEMTIPRKLSAWFKGHQRPAWQPKVRPADAWAEGSKFAGAPWLAQDEEWPICVSCRRPMQFFFQLDLDRLPKGATQGFGSGLLQLFMCTWTEGCQPIRDPHRPFSEATLVRIVKAKKARARKSKSLALARTCPPWKSPRLARR